MNAPRQLTLTLSVDMTVESDRKDWEIVMCYLDKKSLRQVARTLLVSHETVSTALDRYHSKMSIAMMQAKNSRKAPNT